MSPASDGHPEGAAGSLDAWLGQYRHDSAAAAEPSGQMIRLEGRRFLHRDSSFSAEKFRLDSRQGPCSGAAPLWGRGT